MSVSALARRSLHTSLLGLALLSSPAMLASAQRPSSQPAGSAGASPADFVVVTEDYARFVDGCDAISIHDVRDGTAVHLGETNVSPGTIAATSDLRRFLAPWSNGAWFTCCPDQPRSTPFIYGLERRESPDGSVHFNASPIVGDDFSEHGGIAVLPDDETFLVAAGWEDHGIVRPYQVRKYEIPTRWNEGQPTTIGPSLGEVDVEGAATVILLADEGRVAHVLTASSFVHSFDTRTMVPVAPDVRIPPEWQVRIGDRSQRVAGGQHAALSLDERHLYLNQGSSHGADPPGLTVVDLQSRTVSFLSLGARVTFTGDVAVNRGWEGRGLVAVHTMDAVRIFAPQPDGTFTPLGHGAVREIDRDLYSNTGWGPWPSVAWSTDGRRIIAAAGRGFFDPSAEFVAFDVFDGGRGLRYAYELTTCEVDRRNVPNDVFTGNGLVPSPTATQGQGPTNTPSRTRTPTPTPRPSYTPESTPTAASTRSATSSPTASVATRTATSEAGSSFLPIVGREP